MMPVAPDSDVSVPADPVVFAATSVPDTDVSVPLDPLVSVSAETSLDVSLAPAGVTLSEVATEALEASDTTPEAVELSTPVPVTSDVIEPELNGSPLVPAIVVSVVLVAPVVAPVVSESPDVSEGTVDFSVTAAEPVTSGVAEASDAVPVTRVEAEPVGTSEADDDVVPVELSPAVEAEAVSPVTTPETSFVVSVPADSGLIGDVAVPAMLVTSDALEPAVVEDNSETEAPVVAAAELVAKSETATDEADVVVPSEPIET